MPPQKARPSLSLKGRQLVPLLKRLKHRFGSLVLFPQESQETSKTGEQVEGLLLDLRPMLQVVCEQPQDLDLAVSTP